MTGIVEVLEPTATIQEGLMREGAQSSPTRGSACFTRLEIAMQNVASLLIGAGILAAAGAAAAADTTPPPAASAASAAAAPASAAEVRIPFANHGGIWSWQVENSTTMLIQSQNRKWYRATLMSSCFDLPFAETVGFETNPDGSFDKFGAVKVRDQRCPLVSLVETAAPAKKVKNVKPSPKLAPPAITHTPAAEAPK